MTSDELRAAALEVAHACERVGKGIPLDTLYVLAEIALADHPADDDKPVTEEWLRAVGFDAHRVVQGVIRRHIPSGGSLAWHPPAPDYGRPKHCWTLTDKEADGVYLPDLPTRGHVRQLCSALGIPLKESP